MTLSGTTYLFKSNTFKLRQPMPHILVYKTKPDITVVNMNVMNKMVKRLFIN